MQNTFRCYMSVRNNRAVLAIRRRNCNPRRAGLLFSNLQCFHKGPPLRRSEYASFKFSHIQNCICPDQEEERTTRFPSPWYWWWWGLDGPLWGWVSIGIHRRLAIGGYVQGQNFVVFDRNIRTIILNRRLCFLFLFLCFFFFLSLFSFVVLGSKPRAL